MQLKDNKEMILPARLCLHLEVHGRVTGCYVCFSCIQQMKRN